MLSRSKGPTGTLGYAVTREGAARLLYLIGVLGLTLPVDLEIMWLCYWHRLRCLEVSPPLIGLYIEPGYGSKASDISSIYSLPEFENPIGPMSVKARMRLRFDPWGPLS